MLHEPAELLKAANAMAEAGTTKHEIALSQFPRANNLAAECLHRVNGEIVCLMHRAWGRLCPELPDIR
uniref:Uncharacterized protein n=1 Tax=Rhizobium leguminosarum TaxID=384 RepID=A0A179BYI2_RHILE|nr:hypothetical protein A4U53_38425 [Rhizobium leguminosarum]